jgi:hypothetical protein
MTEPFLARIPTLSDTELEAYLRSPLEYRREAVEAALSEWLRRGLPLSEDARARLLEALDQRDRSRHTPGPALRWLGTGPAERRRSLRRLTAAVLVAGLGAAAVIWVTAPLPAPNPLGYEPSDTKRYLRDLELYGGKVNVLATEGQQWFTALWTGRGLAKTVAVATLVGAGGLWWAGHRALAHEEVDSPDPKRP